MGREIAILWAGRHRRDDWDQLCRRYRDRIARFGPIREQAVKVRRGAARLEAEAEALKSALPQPSWAVALASEGRKMTSEAFAVWLERLERDWPHPLVFVVGSDLGLGGAIRESCRETLSLGPMTLPHEMARLVLYEQIYRALCIRAGIKYHREPL